jgi:hypothetical protein
MGYRILNIDPEFRTQWEPRLGLEGPFFYDGNRVLYYDTAEGRYWDPRTDLYLSHCEYDQIAKSG